MKIVARRRASFNLNFLTEVMKLDVQPLPILSDKMDLIRARKCQSVQTGAIQGLKEPTRTNMVSPWQTDVNWGQWGCI